ncbi:MAG: hypothetical protein K0A93_03010 [Desulfuromonadaceae bacterium]|nr:hypothetical protein [Desulfuromonadaceae bacterium]
MSCGRSPVTMNLLIDSTTAGYPSDYLFARIRYRRATLDSSGPGGRGGPRQTMLGEYIWVYQQLNHRLRQQLLPFFEYVELRTLVIILRYLAANDPAAVETQLRLSLLGPQLKKIVRNAAHVATAISTLERQLADSYPYFSGLSTTWLRQGPGGLEQALLGGCLQHAVTRNCCHSLREMLVYLLDMRNLMALHKHLHWQVTTPPPFLNGGTLSAPGCEKIWATRDLHKVGDLMQQQTGLPGDPETIGCEDFLLRGLTRRLRHIGREPLQIGLVLDYLWRCWMAARDRGRSLSGATSHHEPRQGVQ